MNHVLDTSVIAKGLIEPRRKKQDSILEEQTRIYKIASLIMDQVNNKEINLIVPSIALVEIAAVAARLTGKDQRGIQASNYVRKHGNIIYDTSFLNEAIKIASEIHISGFDSVFIACAKLTNSTLITDDKKMHDAAISLAINSKL